MVFKSVKVLIATIGLSLGSAAIAEDLVFAVTGKAESSHLGDKRLGKGLTGSSNAQL